MLTSDIGSALVGRVICVRFSVASTIGDVTDSLDRAQPHARSTPNSNVLIASTDRGNLTSNVYNSTAPTILPIPPPLRCGSPAQSSIHLAAALF